MERPQSLRLFDTAGGDFDRAYNQGALNFQPRIGVAWDAFVLAVTLVFAIGTPSPVLTMP